MMCRIFQVNGALALLCSHDELTEDDRAALDPATVLSFVCPLQQNLVGIRVPEPPGIIIAYLIAASPIDDDGATSASQMST